MAWPFPDTKPLKGAFDQACLAGELNKKDPNLYVDPASKRQVENEMIKLETTDPNALKEIRQTCSVGPSR